MANKKVSTKNEEPVSEISLVKDELKKYVDEKIRTELIEGIERTNKRVIREKNRTIAIKNLFMIVLFIVVIFLLYLLNSVNYFDKYLNTKTSTDVVEIKNNEVKEEEKEEKKEPTLDELKNVYSYLLGNVILNENSKYVEEYYNGELVPELKRYLALSTIDFDTITNETNYSIITDDTLKSAYNELFTDEYIGGDFEYNGANIRYIDKLLSYITSMPLEKSISNIKREIVDITVKDGEVKITTIEGLVIDNKLYNILTKEEIKAYKKDTLVNYKDELNTITYDFLDGKLIGIK